MNKEFEEYCLEQIKKYIPILMLQRHTFELKYGVEHEGSLMECVNNYPYLNAKFSYSNKAVERWKEKRENVIPYIIHEMCHLITDALYNKATARYVTLDEIRYERELLTDYICNIVVNNKL